MICKNFWKKIADIPLEPEALEGCNWNKAILTPFGQMKIPKKPIIHFLSDNTLNFVKNLCYSHVDVK